MSPRRTFATTKDYLAALEPEQAKVLRRVFATVRGAVPAAKPVISYGIPAYKQDRVFIYCAAPWLSSAGLQKHWPGSIPLGDVGQ